MFAHADSADNLIIRLTFGAFILICSSSIYKCNLLPIRFHVHKVEAINKYSFKFSEQKILLSDSAF